MSIGEICERRVPVFPSTTTVLVAARAMHSFGDRLIVVTAERAGRSVAVGIVTEHDLVGVMSQEEDPSRLSVGDVMCRYAPFVSEGDDVLETLCWMRRHGMRDVVVLGEGGAPLGMVSLDQLAESVAGELSGVAAHRAGAGAATGRRMLH